MPLTESEKKRIYKLLPNFKCKVCRISRCGICRGHKCASEITKGHIFLKHQKDVNLCRCQLK